MSAPEPKSAPSRRLRLVLWGGLCLAGVGAAVAMCFQNSPDASLSALEVVLPTAAVLSPFLSAALGCAFCRVFGPIVYQDNGTILGGILLHVIDPLLIAMGYGIYMIHWNFASRAATWLRFVLYLAGLVILVCLNLVAVAHIDYCFDRWYR